jgi:hypothetical protein
MAHTHQTVIIVSFSILLVVLLIFMAIVLKYSDAEQQWPPVVPDCPDYWYDSFHDVSAGGDPDDPDSGDSGDIDPSDPASTGVSVCYNVKNLGNCTDQKVMNFNQSQYTGVDGDCAKWKWATSCGVTWDGITDENPCDIAALDPDTDDS